MNEHRATTGGEVKQGAWVGPAGWPAEYEVDCFSLTLKQGHRNLTGCECLPDVSHEQIDNRGTAERPRHLLAKRGQSADE